MTDKTDISGHQVAAHIDALRDEVDSYLASLAEEKPPDSLYIPVAGVLKSRGKRLRPLLTLFTAEAFGSPVDDAMPAAAAVEAFHCFTLVHDDIMDQSETRRGRPAVHAEWGIPAGILTGDFLLGLSYQLLARLPDHALVPSLNAFSDMVIRLCEGQALDAEFESSTDVGVGDYLDMISRKTGALLVTSLHLGGIVGRASADQMDTLGHVGYHLGLAFQIQDDLLDLTADPRDWGKPIGTDLVSGKRAFLLLKAIEIEARTGSTWFRSALDAGGIDPSRIDDARARMDDLGVLKSARNAILHEYGQALKALASVEQDVSFAGIRSIIEQMQTRIR